MIISTSVLRMKELKSLVHEMSRKLCILNILASRKQEKAAKVNIYFTWKWRADQSFHPVQGMNCFRPLKHWDRWLETHWRDKCVCVCVCVHYWPIVLGPDDAVWWWALSNRRNAWQGKLDSEDTCPSASPSTTGRRRLRTWAMTRPLYEFSLCCPVCRYRHCDGV
jgi:hypothetical protein